MCPDINTTNRSNLANFSIGGTCPCKVGFYENPVSDATCLICDVSCASCIDGTTIGCSTCN